MCIYQYLQEDSVEISSHKRTMKKEVEKNRRKCIKDEFNECSRNATEKARNNVPYVKVQNTLYKLNRKFEPNRPKNAQEYVDGLRSKPETYEKYFLSSYGVVGVSSGALFGHPGMLAELENQLSFAWDGTCNVPCLHDTGLDYL